MLIFTLLRGGGLQCNRVSSVTHLKAMLFKPHTISSHILSNHLNQLRSISSLKVVWRKDPELDRAIENDKRFKLCARVVREVLNEPRHVIPLRYLEKRRQRMHLKVKIETFLNHNPGLFDVYLDRIKPKTEPVRFIRFSAKLQNFLEEQKRIFQKNEDLIVAKLCKLLMMSKNKVVSADKLLHVKKEFGFPDDFLVDLVPRYSNYFRLIGSPGEGQSFLELVNWEPKFAKSVIEHRAEEESERIGIRVRPNFRVQLPSGFVLKKDMRDWVRDWMELNYVSPYADVSHLEQNSREMEKRMVGVFHELLSLSLYKRIPVPILGKFCDEYRFSNAFSSVFTRHSGIFYMSLKGGIETAVLREAYEGDKLVDLDPLLEIKDKFVELLEEGWRQRAEELRLKQEKLRRDMENSATKVDQMSVKETNVDGRRHVDNGRRRAFKDFSETVLQENLCFGPARSLQYIGVGEQYI